MKPILLFVLFLSGITGSSQIEKMLTDGEEYTHTLFSVIEDSFSLLDSSELDDFALRRIVINDLSDYNSLSKKLGSDSAATIFFENNYISKAIEFYTFSLKSGFICSWIKVPFLEHTPCLHLSYLLVSNSKIDEIFIVNFRSLVTIYNDLSNNEGIPNYARHQSISQGDVKEVYILNREMKVLTSTKWQSGKIIGFSKFEDIGDVALEKFYPVQNAACKYSGTFSNANFRQLVYALNSGFACSPEFELIQPISSQSNIWFR